MSELIPTGITFGAGRRKLNAFFSANTFSEVQNSGLTLNILHVNGNISGNTIFSGSSKLDSLFVSTSFNTKVFSGDPTSGAIVPFSGNNKAFGNYSFVAGGKNNEASGNYSHAEGSGTTASGNYSHAEGYKTFSDGPVSHTEGDSTSATTSQAHAEGSKTLASGIQSHAEGTQTVAKGNFGSHSEGYKTTASGIFGSHAEGKGTSAIGNNSHSEGYNTTANGGASHAEGSDTTTIGNNSHVGGNNSTASGETSFVHSTNSYAISANASILGGEENRIEDKAIRSTILGGKGITGTSKDTVYVPSFVISDPVTPPSSSGSTGTKGTFTYDSNYLYICYATNSWMRLSGETTF